MHAWNERDGRAGATTRPVVFFPSPLEERNARLFPFGIRLHERVGGTRSVDGTRRPIDDDDDDDDEYHEHD